MTEELRGGRQWHRPAINPFWVSGNDQAAQHKRQKRRTGTIYFNGWGRMHFWCVFIVMPHLVHVEEAVGRWLDTHGLACLLGSQHMTAGTCGELAKYCGGLSSSMPTASSGFF
eukprot:1753622-Amphidinium_carterae.2